MKLRFIPKNSLYIFILISLCTTTVCLFAYAISLFITKLNVSAMLVISFALFVCLFTSVVISNYVNKLIEQTLKKNFERAKQLEAVTYQQFQTAYLIMTEANKINGIVQNNAEIIKELSRLLDKTANKNISADNENIN